jgi:hypothetical protein
MTRDLALWTGLLAGPIVWLISFEANFALAPWACVTQGKAALYVVSILALLLSAGSGLLAWREWGELGKESPGDGEGALPRSRVMAIGGVLLSVLFFLIILAQAIPEVMLQACN